MSAQPNDADWEAANAFGRSAGGVDSSLLARYFAEHRVAAQAELLASLERCRDGYLDQMKFCDIEAQPYFREFVGRLGLIIGGTSKARGEQA